MDNEFVRLLSDEVADAWNQLDRHLLGEWLKAREERGAKDAVLEPVQQHRPYAQLTRPVSTEENGRRVPE